MSSLPSSTAPVIVALVPMRHHSERVPGKNYRPFAGQPLYRHIMRSLQACPLISQVMVNTDSPTIMEDLSRCFPNVRVIERPAHLKGDTIPMTDILLHDVSKVEADFYLQTHSTNPLLRADTISRALRLFLENYPDHDSLFSVTRVQSRLWDSRACAINHDPAVLLRTQDLPPVYEENSCLYLFTKETLERRHNRIGEKPLMFEIDRIEAWDIDEEQDFRIAQVLYTEREK